MSHDDAGLRPHIRIESHGVAAHDARVFVVNKDGSEVEISSCVTAAKVDLTVGDLTTATLKVLAVRGRFDAVLDGLIVEHIGSSRIGRLKWRLRKRVWGLKRAIA